MGNLELLPAMLLAAAAVLALAAASVSYDSRAVIIDGQRKILISGSIHYPRSTPEVDKNPIFLEQVHLLFLIFRA